MLTITGRVEVERTHRPVPGVVVEAFDLSRGSGSSAGELKGLVTFHNLHRVRRISLLSVSNQMRTVDMSVLLDRPLRADLGLRLDVEIVTVTGADRLPDLTGRATVRRQIPPEEWTQPRSMCRNVTARS